MKELWLNFKEENGEAKRILVEGEKFSIGRTPDNDLPIPLDNLSRQHAKIERFADVFIISDCGSSNGSTLNNEPLEKPLALKKGDILNLGNALDIEIEITSDKDEEIDNVSPAPGLDDEEDDASAAVSAKSASASSSSGGGSGSLWLLLLAPIFMVLVLLGLGGAILVARSDWTTEAGNKNTDVVKSNNNEDEDFPTNSDKTLEKETPTPTPTPIANSSGNPTLTNSTPANSTPNSTTSPTIEPTEENTPSVKKSDETEKIKFASATFLRRIAFNDPRTFLVDKQLIVLAPKINQFKGSGALAENIKNAKKNASQLTTMAQSKNLKPQFLVNAALTKLGNQRGDVLATAQEMLEVLDNLSIVLGNELADDNLLVIAAYDQGVAKENLKMRDKVARLTQKFPNVRSQTIRTIWFLKENGELSNSEFDFALQFLAIGTITQNPKDFNVSAEALVF